MTATAPHVRWLEACDAGAGAEVGGKFAQLGELCRAGLPVPDGFAVTTAAHRRFLGAAGLEEAIRTELAAADPADVHAVATAAERVRALVEAAAMPAEVEAEIRAAYAELAARSRTGTLAVAVRSSATAEDSATASFAGQLETYLWVRGADAVVDHVRRGWASVFSAAALSYRRERGPAEGELLMGVAVQAMVDARAAGVMFTLNPVNGDPSKIAIEACWGLGQALVGGEVDPDRFLVDKVTLELLERTVGAKAVEYRFDPGEDAVVRTDVQPERSAQPCVGDDVVLALVRIGKEVERHYGAAQDIEWAVGEDGQIRLLQSRPETVWSRREAEPVVEVRPSAVDYVLATMLGRQRKR